MAQTLYPRGTLKKIVKAHANRPLSKNVDILVCVADEQAWLMALGYTRLINCVARVDISELCAVYAGVCWPLFVRLFG